MYLSKKHVIWYLLIIIILFTGCTAQQKKSNTKKIDNTQGPILSADEGKKVNEMISSGNIAGFKEWVNANPDLINAKDPVLQVPILYITVNLKQYEMADFLISRGVNVNNHCISFGKLDVGTALHNASGIGDYKGIEFLISKGADVNEKNGTGVTPLEMVLVTSSNSKELKKIVELFINKGADINTPSVQLMNKTPLNYLMTLEKTPEINEVIELLKKHGAK